MELGPVLFNNPWGLLSLLSVPAILGIYFFRRSFRRKEISGLFLWENVTRSRSSGARMDRPPFSWNLLLQLLIAVLLSLLIARPYYQADQKHHIILIDRSASMHAEQSDGQTSFDRAVNAAQEKLSEVRSGDRVTLLTTGQPSNQVVSDMTNPREAKQRLSDLKPGYQSYDVEKAIQQGYHLAGPSSIMYFFTDHPPSSYDAPLPDRFRWHGVGASLENLALTNVRRTSKPDGPSRVFVQIENYSKTEQAVRLQFRQQDQLILNKNVSVGPDDSWQTTAELNLERDVVEVQLQGEGDALSLDDRVTLRPPLKKLVRAGLIGLDTANRKLITRGLSSVNHVRILKEASREELLNNADVLLGPVQNAPSSSYDGVYLGVKNFSEKQVQQRSFVRGPYFLYEDHPLVRNVVVDGLVFGGVNIDQPPEFHTSLLSVGNTPLLYTGTTGTNQRFFTNFDPHYSTIQNSVAWPMLMTNLVEFTRKQLPGPARSNFRIDEAIELSTNRRVGEDATSPPTWTMKDPSDDTRTFKPGRSVRIQHFSGSPGRYVLRREREEGTKTWPFQVNFLHPEESNVLNLGEGYEERKDRPAEERTHWTMVRSVQFGLILLLALCCIGSWIIADRTGGSE